MDIAELATLAWSFVVANVTWLLTGVNIGFTALSGWLGWKAWRREQRTDYPDIAATAMREPNGGAIRLRVTVANSSRIAWSLTDARIRWPWPGRIVRIRDHLVQDQYGSPAFAPETAMWGRSATFSDPVAPSDSDAQDFLIVSSGQSVHTTFGLWSDEPRRRRYKVKIDRHIQPLKTVIAS